MEILQERANGVVQEFLRSVTQDQSQQQQQPSQEVQMLLTMQAMLQQLQQQQQEIKFLHENTRSNKNKIKPVQPDLFRGVRSSSVVEAWLYTIDNMAIVPISLIMNV